MPDIPTSHFSNVRATLYFLLTEAVKEHTPTKSGIDILPFMLAVVISSMISGVIISKTGHYYPFLVLGPLITPIGGGLLYTIDQFTSSAKLIGYQILLGAGVGSAFQQTVSNKQRTWSLTTLSQEDPTADLSHTPWDH